MLSDGVRPSILRIYPRLYILSSEYVKSVDAYCDQTSGNYQTLLEAKLACTTDSSCSAITDYECEGTRYWLCTGAIKVSAAGSCAWFQGKHQTFCKIHHNQK